MQAASTINCPPEKEKILRAIRLARSAEFREGLKDVTNPYGVGGTAIKIYDILKSSLQAAEGINLKKVFHDIEFAY